METITFSKKLFYALAFFLVLFTACKKDDEDPKPNDQNPDQNPTENTLTAKAGKDTTVQVGTLLELNGSESKDSKNQPYTYQWVILKKPAGSTVNLVNADKQKPTLTPDKIGEYEVELTIANTVHSNKDRMLVNAIVANPLEITDHIKVATILENRIEDPTLPDYIVTKDIGVISELTIKPGVVIAFERNTKFSIEREGLIVAEGTAEKKIKFVGKEATAGYWRGLIIYSTSNANSLNHVEIKHAGSNVILSGKKSALTLFGAAASVGLKNSLITDNEGYGMFVSDGGLIRDFSTNTFTNNTEAGILLNSDVVSKLDFNSVFTGGNGRNVVEIASTIIDDANDAEVVWTGFNDKTPYLITNDVAVATGWKLNPGVTIQFGRNVRIGINETGYITAEGTATDKIILTGATQTAGFWRGLIIYSTSAMNKIKNAEISYSGSNALVSGKKANIAIHGKDSFLDIQNSVIKGSAGVGIFVSYGSKINATVETANTFSDNTEGAIQKD